MSKAGVKLENKLLAHMALHHLPKSHSTTKQVIIATSEESNTALSMTSVLNQISELVRDRDSIKQNLRLQTLVPIQSQLRTRNAQTARTTQKLITLKSLAGKYIHRKTHIKKTQASTASITGRALSTLAQKGNPSGKPTLDTACSQTMIHDKDLFRNYSPWYTNIEVAGGDSIKEVGIEFVNGVHKGSTLTFSDCLHVP